MTEKLPDKPFVCRPCKRRFKTFPDLRLHRTECKKVTAALRREPAGRTQRVK